MRLYTNTAYLLYAAATGCTRLYAAVQLYAAVRGCTSADGGARIRYGTRSTYVGGVTKGHRLEGITRHVIQFDEMLAEITQQLEECSFGLVMVYGLLGAISFVVALVVAIIALHVCL